MKDIPGNHDVKATENSHIGHCTHPAESVNVKEQKSQRRN